MVHENNEAASVLEIIAPADVREAIREVNGIHREVTSRMSELRGRRRTMNERRRKVA